jgi:hypothetical protein
MASFEFQLCRLATREGSEEGVLCMRDSVLFAILAPREGLVIRDLDEAGEWLKQGDSRSVS